jgi:elongation factor P
MASVSEFRNGMAIKYNNDVWVVTDFQHVNPGNWRAFIRTKLKQLKSGKVVDVTFRQNDPIEEVRLEEREMQFLYAAGDELCFMDTENYEQINVNEGIMGGQRKFLKENNLVNVQLLEGRPVSATLPMFITLKVTSAPPGVKGDTVSNLQKSVTLETGAEIQAPLFVKDGDTLKIDTRDGRYIERVSS